MKCLRCQAENRQGRRFCAECGTADLYWSSSTSVGFSFSAWLVGFGDGNVLALSKNDARRVRAVRGGQ